MAPVVKNPPASAGDIRDVASIPGSGRSPAGGHGNPLQYSFLENPMDRGAWWAPIHRVTKSQIWLKWLSMQCNQSFISISQLGLTLCDPMDCSTPGFPFYHQLPALAQTHVIELVMPSNLLILCHPLLLPPSIFASIRVFSNESVLGIRWLKYPASASVLPMNIQNWFPLGLTGQSITLSAM